MKILNTCSIVCVSLALPVLAFAQTADTKASDAKYCAALTDKYMTYVAGAGSSKREDQNIGARLAVDKCKAGDTSGIPVLEKALKDAKLDLPPRT
jgi:hypothetical protein